MGYPDPDPVHKAFTVGNNGIVYHASDCCDPIGYLCDCGASDANEFRLREAVEAGHVTDDFDREAFEARMREQKLSLGSP